MAGREAYWGWVTKVKSFKDIIALCKTNGMEYTHVCCHGYGYKHACCHGYENMLPMLLYGGGL